VDAGEVFGLGHFEGDGEGAFLAFAAELGGGFFVEEELELVAVRPDEGGAVGAFAGVGLGEFKGEIVFDAGLVFQAEILGIIGDAAAGEADKGRETGDELGPAADELVAGGDEFAGEAVKGGFIGGALLEEGVAGADGVHVALEQGKVAGIGLGEQKVEKAAARTAGALDEFEVLGAEDDGAERAQVAAEFFDGLGIEREVTFAGGPVHFDVVLAGADDAAAAEVAFLAVPDHLGAADAAEGAESGEKVDGLEDVGLALGVVAEEELEARGKVDVQPRVIAEVTKSEMGQMHGGKMAGGGRIKKLKS